MCDILIDRIFMTTLGKNLLLIKLLLIAFIPAWRVEKVSTFCCETTGFYNLHQTKL